MNRKLVFVLLLLSYIGLNAQPVKYTTGNVHAHNDYDHNVPFVQAYALQLGSIEADVLWIRDTLFVAHSARELKKNVLFGGSYLQKLDASVKQHNGYAYGDTSALLQLLIDIKTDSLTTLDAVLQGIQQYPALMNNRSIRFVITGRQLPAEQFGRYPSYLSFDGDLNNPSHIKYIDRIGLFSADFSRYSKWKGEGNIPDADLLLIRDAISKAHRMHKQMRFWGVPDNPNTWRIMMELGVDYINTDRIEEVAKFINKL